MGTYYLLICLFVCINVLCNKYCAYKINFELIYIQDDFLTNKISSLSLQQSIYMCLKTLK